MPTGTEPVTLFDSGSMIATELGATTVPPPEPWPRAKTGMATAAASTPISAAPAYMRRRLRVSSTSSVFSWRELVGEALDHELGEALGTVEVLEAPLAEVANR